MVIYLIRSFFGLRGCFIAVSEDFPLDSLLEHSLEARLYNGLFRFLKGWLGI